MESASREVGRDRRADGVAGGALPAAVLWDMDGTLIDTEPLWMAAETELVTAHGGVWTAEDGIAMIGTAMRTAARLLQARGVALGVDEIVGFLNSRVAAGVAAAVPWRPGALETLTWLRAAGVPMALVTSSFRELAHPFAATAGFFDVVVAGDDVQNPKPDPEPYTTAARLLGVDAAACVAVEDSRTGIASALASGARVLAVEAHQEVPAQPGLSRTGSLVDVTPVVLRRLHAGEVLDLRDVRAAAVAEPR